MLESEMQRGRLRVGERHRDFAWGRRPQKWKELVPTRPFRTLDRVLRQSEEALQVDAGNDFFREKNTLGIRSLPDIFSLTRKSRGPIASEHSHSNWYQPGQAWLRYSMSPVVDWRYWFATQTSSKQHAVSEKVRYTGIT